jgi:aminopeptidase-like protein
MSVDESAEIESYFDRLWPLFRSLTGAGVRKTHDILSEIVPLKRIEIASGTQVFDWVVPREWVVREAYVLAPNGTRILDIRENNLHLLNYSAPFKGRVPKEELEQHLYSLPEMPNAIPYVTSYYKERWGFCLAHSQRQALEPGEYEVVIDTELKQGSLTIGEAVLPGETDEEVLISTYTCHPSLANNELSGPVVASFLYRRLSKLSKRRLTYRFLFVPETIGSLVYLSAHGEHLRKKLIAGYVVTCAGDRGPFTYKKSRRGNTLADRAAQYVLTRREGPPPKIVDFFPTGSDERQYCSPGFDLPVGSIMRTMYATYKEYHTSLDNRDFISFAALRESVDVYERVCQLLDANRTYRNTIMFGEPQLGKRGLYPTVGGPKQVAEEIEDMMWLLNLADGQHDLLQMAERSGKDFFKLHEIAGRCLQQGVLA